MFLMATEKQEVIGMHYMYRVVAEYLEVELSDEYKELGVFPNSIYRTIDDHKKALNELSHSLSENSEIIDEPLNLHVSDPEIYKAGNYSFNIWEKSATFVHNKDDVFRTVRMNKEKGIEILNRLSSGKSIEETIDHVYDSSEFISRWRKVFPEKRSTGLSENDRKEISEILRKLEGEKVKNA